MSSLLAEPAVAAAAHTDLRSARGRALVPVLLFLGMVVSVISSLGAPLIPTIATDYRVTQGAAQWSLPIALLVGAVEPDPGVERGRLRALNGAARRLQVARPRRHPLLDALRRRWGEGRPGFLRGMAAYLAASAFLFRAMAADVPNVYDGNGHGEPTRGAAIPHRVGDLDEVTPL